jgi:hypothetical protein
MIAPLHIDELLHRRVAAFDPPLADFDRLCDTATVTWLAARLLRRYAHEHAGTIAPDQASRVTHALQTIDHEMRWIRVCGETAEADDLTTAVSTAVVHARYVAALLGSGGMNAVPPPHIAPTGDERLGEL